jgi:hypothetical protein
MVLLWSQVNAKFRCNLLTYLCFFLEKVGMYLAVSGAITVVSINLDSIEL